MSSPSLFDRFAQRATSRGHALAPWRPKVRREFTRQIIKTTSWDELDFKLARKDKDIDKAIRDLYLGDLKNPEERPGYLNAPELIQDIFMTFLKPVPMLHKKSEVKRDARLNGKFVEQLMALNDWERLHDQTATDAMLAKMATTVVVEALQEMIKQHREAVKQANEDRQASGDPAEGGPPTNGGESWDEESGKRKGGKGGSSGGGGGKNQAEGVNADGGHTQTGEQDDSEKEIDLDASDDDDAEEQEIPWGSEQEMRDSIREQLEEQRKQEEARGAKAGEFRNETGEDDEEGDDAEANLDEFERELSDDWLEREYEDTDWEELFDNVDFGRHVNGALQQAANQIDDLESARKGVGIEDEEWRMMDPTARLAIAEKLNTPRMKQIAEMVGRMKRFALSKQAQKIIDAPHEIYDVEMGPTDIRRVMRSEFAYLGHEDAKFEFYRKFINGELLQYKERGHEDVGKGPMVVCIDNSGSMGGAPENWAKGVAEALRRVCAEQRRDYEAIYFETNRHRERFEFPMGQGPFEKVLTFLSVSAGGGTEFDGVLAEALAKCVKHRTDTGGEGKSDIVFITDGEASLNDTWIEKFNEERKANGVRVFSIYISAYDSSRNSATKLLQKFSDTTVPVKALEVNDDASATLFEII